MNQTTLVIFTLLVASDGFFIKKGLQTIDNVANSVVLHQQEYTLNESKDANQKDEDPKPTQELNEETITEDVGGKVVMSIDVRSVHFEEDSRIFIDPGSNCWEGTKADTVGLCRIRFG